MPQTTTTNANEDNPHAGKTAAALRTIVPSSNILTSNQISIQQTTTINNIHIKEINHVILHTSAEIEVHLYDDMQYINTIYIPITGSEYRNWETGNTDNYIETYVNTWLITNHAQLK